MQVDITRNLVSKWVVTAFEKLMVTTKMFPVEVNYLPGFEYHKFPIQNAKIIVTKLMKKPHIYLRTALLRSMVFWKKKIPDFSVIFYIKTNSLN